MVENKAVGYVSLSQGGLLAMCLKMVLTIQKFGTLSLVGLSIQQIRIGVACNRVAEAHAVGWSKGLGQRLSRRKRRKLSRHPESDEHGVFVSIDEHKIPRNTQCKPLGPHQLCSTPSSGEVLMVLSESTADATFGDSKRLESRIAPLSSGNPFGLQRSSSRETG